MEGAASDYGPPYCVGHVVGASARNASRSDAGVGNRRSGSLHWATRSVARPLQKRELSLTGSAIEQIAGFF
jgi:hypothetical protein